MIKVFSIINKIMKFDLVEFELPFSLNELVLVLKDLLLYR